MIMRALFGLACALALAGCSGAQQDLPPLDRARAALAQGDGLGAEVMLRQLLSDGVPQSQIAAYLGEAELQQGELVEARRWLGNGQFSDDTVGHGFHMLGRLEMREGNLPAAGQAFDRAHARIPDSPDLWVDIGRLRYRGGEQKQAVEASMRAVELGPEVPAALLLRAQLVRDGQGMEAALPWFEAGLKVAPDDLDLLGDYAATLGDLGRAKEMLVVVRHMATLDDRNPRLFYLQAVLAARGGDFGLARILLTRAGSGVAGSSAGMLLSGVIDIQNGNYQSAAQVLDRLATMQPDSRHVRDLLAQAIALGLNDRELDYRFGERARLASTAPYLVQLTGRSLEALDRRADAAPLLDRAARPRSANLAAIGAMTSLRVAEVRRNEGGAAIQSLIRGKIRSGQTAGAIGDADGFRRKFPGSADALALAGDARLAARQPGAAIGLYREAAAIRRTWPLVRKMVVALKSQGKRSEAIALVENYLRGDPANAEASAELARLVIDAGDWTRGALLLDHAIDHGRSRDPELWRLRAQAALRQGDVELAFDSAVYAYALQPMSRQATATLVDVLEVRGQTKLATGLRRKLARMTA